MLVYCLADLYEVRRLEDLRLNKVLQVVSMEFRRLFGKRYSQ
jgi:hypothetical protein